MITVNLCIPTHCESGSLSSSGLRLCLCENWLWIAEHHRYCWNEGILYSWLGNTTRYYWYSTGSCCVSCCYRDFSSIATRGNRFIKSYLVWLTLFFLPLWLINWKDTLFLHILSFTWMLHNWLLSKLRHNPTYWWQRRINLIELWGPGNSGGVEK